MEPLLPRGRGKTRKKTLLRLVDIKNHHLHDNAHDVIDWEARKIRPYMEKQTDYWRKQRQVSRPIKEDLRNDHLTNAAFNPKVITRMYGRGAEINTKLFLEGNVNVDHSPGKIKLEDNRTMGSFQRDYVEPQGV
jgi:hypothetical protein